MKTKKLVYSALLIALGIIFPYITHITNIPGNIFLPMHIPVLIAGFIVGPSYGGIIGLLLPILNHILSGMPPVPILYSMTLELLTYGLITGFLYLKTKKIIPSLVIAMISGRIVSGLTSYILFTFLGLGQFSMKFWITGSVVTALPGIVIQLILIPILVNILVKKNKA